MPISRLVRGRLVESARVSRFLAVASLILAVAPGVAQAQLADQLTASGVSCAGDIGNVGSCTAGEIALASVSNVVFQGKPTTGGTCYIGETLTATLAEVTYRINTRARYNLLMWIGGEQGTNPAEGAAINGTGTCTVATVPEPFDTFPPTDPANPFLDLDQNGIDVCADIESFAGDITRTFTNLEFECQDNDTDGFADVNVLLTWQQNSDENCGTGPADDPVFVIGSPSKCDQQLLNSQLAIIEPATLTVVKNANGGDDSFSFQWDSTNNQPTTSFSLDTSTGPGTAQRQFLITTGFGDSDFRVTEQLSTAQLNAGWAFETAECVDGTGATRGTLVDNGGGVHSIAGMTINEGDDIICTFVNNAPAQVTVAKSTQGGDATFPFLTDLPGGDFDLTTTSGSADTGPIIVPVPDSTTGRAVSILEAISLVPGWNLADITCSGTAETVVDNAVYFDLQPGDDVTCTFTNVADGTVTIIKDTLGGDGTFQFTTDVPGATSPFSITTVDNNESVSIATPPPGTYTVSEIVPSGWDLTDISCIEDGIQNSGPIDADTAQIIVEAGETIACTFTNTQRGQILLVKLTDPVGSDVFGFTSTSGTTTPIPASFDLTAGVPVVFANGGAGLLPGQYTVTENDPTPGFVLTDLTCEDTVNPGPNDSTGDVPSRTATINLDPGELVRCTFTNTEQSNLTIRKAVTVNGPDNSTFDFTTNTLPGGDFSLGPVSAGTPEIIEFLNITPGTYDVAEDTIAATAEGWALISATCNDGSSPAAIDLAPGEDVICTFTNAPLGSASVVKTTIGGDGAFQFKWGTEINGSIPEGATEFFGLTTSGGSASQDFSYSLLIDNPYDLTEAAIPAPTPDGLSWTLTDISCFEDVNNDSTFDPGENGADATLVAQSAETVACTFTNTLDGKLVITKQTLPDGAADSFTFTGDVAGDISDGQSLETIGQPGTYTSTEQVPAGWVVTGITCSGAVNSTVTIGTDGDTNFDADFDAGDDSVNVDLAAGEIVECTFENTQEGSITIVKNVVGSDDAFDFVSTELGDFTIDTAVDNSAVFQNLLPLPAGGTYDIAETPDGSQWQVTNIVCTGATDSTVLIGSDLIWTDGDTNVSIDLAPGEDIECTFTNTELAWITVFKTTDPTGSTQEFAFTGAHNTSLVDQTSNTVLVLPGTYTTTEAATTGWDLTAITCTDTDSTGDIGALTATFRVTAGERVTCQFTNTQRGTITLVKNLPNDNGGDATAADFQAYIDGSPVAWGTPLEYEPGTYTASEDTLTGYTPSDWSGDCTAAGVIDLGPGENLTCQITNDDDAPTITLIKSVTNDNGGNAGPDDFGISVGGTVVTSGSTTPVTANTPIAIDEAGLTGYAFVSITGDAKCPAALGGTVTLDEGEDITCTITNDDIAPTLTLIKSVTNDNGGNAGPDDFGISVGGTPVTSGASNSYNANTPLAIDEAGLTGYTFVSITGDAKCPAALGGTVTLDEGENVTCTITNDDVAPTLTLIKSVTNDNGGNAGPDDFGISVGGTPVTSGASNSYNANTPLAIDEAGLTGYTFVSITGDAKCPAALGGTVTLDEGDAITCTITNDDVAPTLTLIKSVTNDNGGNAGPDDFGISVGGNVVTSGATIAYDANTPLAINEAGLDGYNFVSLTGDAKCPAALGGTVTLDEGENVTCTITNDDDAPGLTLVKVVVNDNGGNLGPDDFGLTVGGLPVASGSTTAVEANTPVAINEASVDGYDFVSITGDAKCPAALGGTVTLDPGENVSCTITNDDVAPKLTLTKVVENNYFGTAVPDDFGISVGGNVVTSGATLEYDANVALAIDETQVDGYEFVSITGDAACPQALGGTITLDPGDDISCTITNRDIAPDVNLAKTVNGPATLENDGTYTVAYTITATNASQGIGRYNLVDTFSPGAGITFNSATLQYQAGTENDQSGTIAGTLSNGGQWVTGEDLGIGLSESWIVTANFSVDPATLDPATAQCDPGAPAINTGFYNAVSGVDQESNTDDNATCTGVPAPGLNLAKSVDGPATLENDGTYTVVYTVSATNTGEGPGSYDVVDTFSPATGITLNTAAIAYGGGETQSGTVTSPFASGATAVSNEALAAGASETWTITANFTVDPAVLVPAEGQCDPANPVANTGFYNAVSGVDSEGDTDDNDACTGVPDASLNLAKTVVGPAVLENDGTYTVEYTVTATNSGDGPGVYDVVDTFSLPNGVTVNSAEIAYGGEETQSGTVSSPFASGDTVVDGEALAAGASETWTVTANFTVDQDVLDPAAAACDSANPVANTGFYNAVSGVDSEAVTDDNATCTDIPRIDITTLTGVCVNDVPYIDWSVSTIGLPNATAATVRVYGDGGNGSTDPADYTQLLIEATGLPLSGRTLWPGATIDAQGNGLTWPGWEQLPDGTWVEVDDGLVPSLLVEFEVNPTASQIVQYPPRTANCVPPQRAPLPPALDVPVNNPWALLMLLLSVLGIGWYYRPTAR